MIAMAKKESSLKNMLIALFVITAVSGGLLGLVYGMTKDTIAEVDAKIKAAKTPKDADDATKAEYNEKRKALRAEKKKLEMEKITSIHKAESLERGADTYCDVFTLLTGKLLDVRKTPRINPYTPLTEEEELEVLNSLWANKGARRAPKKKA